MNPITAGAQFRMLSNKTKIRIQLAAWVVLLLAAGAVVIFPPLRSAFLAKVMLFTQKSPQTLAGALRSVGSWQLGYAMVLAVFREMFLPWIAPVLTIADTMVFGTVPGMMVAWLGNMIGASICFVLSNLLFCRRSLYLPLQSAVQRWGSIGCVVLLFLSPSAGGIAGYLMGFGGLRWKRWFWGIAAGEFAVTLAYGFCCSPYVTTLPNNVTWIMRIIAVILLVGIIAVHRLKKFTSKDRNKKVKL